MSIFNEYSLMSVQDDYVMFDGKLLKLPVSITSETPSPGLLIFYSEICPHCTTMYNNIKVIENTLKKIGIKLDIKVVPLPSEEGHPFDLLGKYFNIVGVPTIFYHPNLFTPINSKTFKHT